MEIFIASISKWSTIIKNQWRTRQIKRLTFHLIKFNYQSRNVHRSSCCHKNLFSIPFVQKSRRTHSFWGAPCTHLSLLALWDRRSSRIEWLAGFAEPVSFSHSIWFSRRSWFDGHHLIWILCTSPYSIDWCYISFKAIKIAPHKIHRNVNRNTKHDRPLVDIVSESDLHTSHECRRWPRTPAISRFPISFLFIPGSRTTPKKKGRIKGKFVVIYSNSIWHFISLVRPMPIRIPTTHWHWRIGI